MIFRDATEFSEWCRAWCEDHPGPIEGKRYRRHECLSCLWGLLLSHNGLIDATRELVDVEKLQTNVLGSIAATLVRLERRLAPIVEASLDPLLTAARTSNRDGGRKQSKRVHLTEVKWVSGGVRSARSLCGAWVEIVENSGVTHDDVDCKRCLLYGRTDKR